MKSFDLHIHSDISDGKLSRKEILGKAIEMEMIALSFTDHNFLDEFPMQKGIEIISGVEIDCGLPYKMHILGYFVTDYERLNNVLISLQEENDLICTNIIENLRKRHQLDITNEDIKMFKKQYLTKRNVIQILFHKGYVKTVSEAKEKYTGSTTKDYIPIKKLSVKEVIELIIECGGIPVLAHPNTIFDQINVSDFEPLLKELITYGLAGLESINLKEGIQYKPLFDYLANKYNIITTAGSDFHNFERDKLGVRADEEKYLNPLLKRGK